MSSLSFNKELPLLLLKVHMLIGPKKCTVSYQLVAFVALAFINLSLLDEAKKLMLNTNKDLTINFKDALLLQFPWFQSFTL
jgi:hypothetical protein